MENKQKAIEKAYGEYYIKCNPNEDGWSSLNNIRFKQEEVEFSTKNHYHWRPKSLQGIETNNGWIKIESEADLPKESGHYFIFQKEIKIDFWNNTDKEFELWNKETITHYQQIIKPKNPIY